jgi:hypothetical protein
VPGGLLVTLEDIHWTDTDTLPWWNTSPTTWRALVPEALTAAARCLYLAILDPTGKGRKRWTNRWKAALNAFDITGGRLTAGRN